MKTKLFFFQNNVLRTYLFKSSLVSHFRYTSFPEAECQVPPAVRVPPVEKHGQLYVVQAHDTLSSSDDKTTVWIVNMEAYRNIYTHI
jgi:hypothetical protein